MRHNNFNLGRISNDNFERLLKLSTAFMLFVVFGVVSGEAQQRQPARGFQFANSYASNGFDAVNVSNGNVIVNLPLASLPAGNGPGFTVTLQYNSKLWDSKQAYHTDAIQGGNGDQFPDPTYSYTSNELQQSDRGGWKLLSSYRIIETNRLNLEDPNPCLLGDPVQKLSARWKMEVEFPDGSIKEFIPVIGIRSRFEGYYNVDFRGVQYSAATQINPATGVCYVVENTGQVTTSGMHYISTDGSRLRLFIPYQSNNWKMYSPDGTVVEFSPPDDSTVGQRITDRNGNKVEIKGNVIVDQFGRSITIDERGVTVKGVGGEDLTTQIVGGSRWVYRKYQMIENGETVPFGTERSAYINVSIPTYDRVILPAQLGGQSYIFDYYADTSQPSGMNYTDGWGALKSVTVPGGAKATYSYTLSGGTETDYASDVLADQVTQRAMTFTELYDGVETPRTETSYYSSSPGFSAFWNPDGSGVSERSFHSIYGTYWDSGLTYRSLNTGDIKTEKIWKQNLPYFSGPPFSAQSAPGNANAYVKTEFTTITNAVFQPYLTAIKDFNYEKNGNITRITEYDWVDYNSVPRANDRPTGIPSNAAIKRITANEYYNQAPDSESGASSPYTYENPNSPKLKNVIKSTEIQDGNGTPVSRSEFFYDDPNNKGNLIETRVWDSSKGAYSNPLTAANSISSTAQYDQYGNPTLTTDAKGVQTQITYGDIVTPTGTVNGLYPTQIETASNYALLKRASTAVYDFYSGLATTATDVDNNVSVVTEYDALGRPLKVRGAAGTPLESQVRTEYNDAARRVIARSDLETIGDGKKVAVQHYDQLGRVRLSRSIENIATEDPYNEAHGIKVETRYQTGNPNSYQITSNPFRAATATAATTEQSMGWTRSKSWNTGRKQEIETFSGATLPAPWGTNANSTGIVTTDIDADRTLVTDQTGKQRISRTNALGQLKDIWEVTASGTDTEPINFPNQTLSSGYRTSYGYDTLNNLTAVNQGVQTRSFAYNSLSRLLSATNPESGLIQYQYDNNGNLTQKTDARNVVTNYVYDALNRVTQRNYTAPGGLPNYQATPNVAYTYDDPLIANSKGKLTKVSSSVSTTEYTAFDILGRAASHKQTTDGNIYTTGYTYNLSGALIEETYPSGRVVKNVLDNDGDLAQVQSKKNAGDFFRNYAGSFVYTAAGAVSSLRLGNGKFENTQFNSRLQPTQIGLGTSASTQNLLKLNFDYGTTDNNGNVKSQQITVPTVGANQGFTANQTYTYDSLNRIKQATETIPNQTGWQQTFQYDRFGNRRFDTANNATTTLTPNCQVAVCNPEINQTDNRLIGYGFDSSGNTTQDANGQTFIYDSENKQVQVNNASGIVGQYFYNGDGQRVKKVVPSTGETTVFVYDASNRLVAEYSTVVASPTEAKASYLTNDHLGSPRITTDALGQVISRRDFMPFGEEISRANYGSDSVRLKFAGYENDAETDLDYAQARYYNSSHGRFTSTDPIIISDAQVSNPQGWNLYAYVGNNPLAFTDPTGMERVKLGQHTDEEIEKRLKTVNDEIDRIGKIKGKTAEQKTEQDKLKAERTTLGIEKEGNKVVGSLLKSLESKGELNGLKLTDFTSSTDSANDFKDEPRIVGDPGKSDDGKVAGLFVLNGYSKEIFVNTKSNDYALYKSGDADYVLYGGTALRHEQVHRDNYPKGDSSEKAAYTVQLSILQKYGPAAFKSKDNYKIFTDHVTGGTKLK